MQSSASRTTNNLYYNPLYLSIAEYILRKRCTNRNSPFSGFPINHSGLKQIVFHQLRVDLSIRFQTYIPGLYRFREMKVAAGRVILQITELKSSGCFPCLSVIADLHGSLHDHLDFLVRLWRISQAGQYARRIQPDGDRAGIISFLLSNSSCHIPRATHTPHRNDHSVWQPLSPHRYPTRKAHYIPGEFSLGIVPSVV